jgi:integrase
VQRALRFEHNQPVVEDRLKTKASRRVIPIPPQLVEALKEEKKNSNSEFIIRNSEDGPISGTQFRRLWNYVVRRTAKDRIYYRYADGKKVAHHVKAKLGEKAKRGGFTYTIDFDVTPHILRHTYITNLLLAGVDVKTVQYLAGHERAKITLDIYAHLTYNRPEEILGKINLAFAEG